MSTGFPLMGFRSHNGPNRRRAHIEPQSRKSNQQLGSGIMAAKLSIAITWNLFNLWSKWKFESTCLLGQAPPNPSVVPAFEFRRRPGCASLRTSGAGALLSNTAPRPAETARSNSQASLVLVLALLVAFFLHNSFLSSLALLQSNL